MAMGLRFGIGPLRVYIPLTGGRKRRKPRRPRKPMSGPVKLGVAVGGASLAGWAAFFGPLPRVHHPAPHSGTATATRSELGVMWPLTVDSVTLACVDLDQVTLSYGGTTYALSNTAQASGRWPADITPLLNGPANSYYVSAGMGELRQKGEELC